MLRRMRSWLWRRRWWVAGCTLAALAATWLFIALLPPLQLRIIHALENEPAPAEIANGGSILLFPSRYRCPAICVQALASGRYQVVTRNGQALQIQTLRPRETCGRDFYRDAYGMFVSQGYLDLCAESKVVAMPDDAIVLREFRFGHGSVSAITGGATVLRALDKDSVPVESGPVLAIAARIPDFAGTMYEVALRHRGQERVVGRRFSGELAVAGAGQSSRIAVHPEFEPNVFYAKVLGLAPMTGARPGPASLAAIFDIMEARMETSSPIDRTSAARELPVAEAFSMVAAHAAADERPLVQDRLARFIAKDRPIFVHAVLNTLYFQYADPAETKAVLLRFLDSKNPNVVSVALRKVNYEFGMRGDPDILERVRAIPLRPELFTYETELTRTGPSYALDQAAVDAPAGQAAERLLLAATNIIPGYCRILLSMIAGDPDSPDAAARAFDDYLATAPAVFTACSAHVGLLQNRFHLGPLTNAQIMRLNSRFDLVPVEHRLDLASRFLNSEHARAITNDRFVAVIRELHDIAARDGRTTEAASYQGLLDLLSRQ